MINDHTQEGTSRDFDFLFGSWRVVHNKLKERLVGCEDWEEFEGRTAAFPILGGLGNIDDNELELPSGRYRALSIRKFDPFRRIWSIWWLDHFAGFGRSGGSTLAKSLSNLRSMVDFLMVWEYFTGMTSLTKCQSKFGSSGETQKLKLPNGNKLSQQTAEKRGRKIGG